jgi:prophage antirepressor-like protein
MTNISVFDFNSNQVRIVLVDNNPWFAAVDVCRVLEVANVGQALSRLDEDEKNTIILNDGNRGNPNTSIISESGLYSLTLSSRKPQAKDFKRWVTREVLPSIRKTGGYSLNKPASPFWWQRLVIDQETNRVPNGYFSIFREVIPLVAELETAGYVVPDNAVPDISVGRKWAGYLREIEIVVEEVAKQYPHTYPDRRGSQDCYCYPEKLLPTFRQWFRDKYKTDHLYKYLKNKDKSALPAVEKIVKALSAAV